MPVVPFLKTPLTDLTGIINTSQYFGNCREIEMKMINCLEAYGMDRGFKYCADYLSDFQECFSRDKQISRLNEMRAERNRRVKSGDSTLEELYGPSPRQDSYPVA